MRDPRYGPRARRLSLRPARRGPKQWRAFAWGEYVRGNRRLALHFRASLGLVTYHFGDVQVSHEAFVRTVHGASGGNAYPGFSDDPVDSFRHLRHDLGRYGDVFLRGADEELETLLLRVLGQEQRRPSGFKALFGAAD